MFKWFKGCTTAESVKKKYRDLCKEYHPDLHPGEANEAAMKEINAEYDRAWAKYKHVHSGNSTTEGNKSNARENGTQSRTEVPDGFKDIINSIIGCDGIEIDLVGSWVWVTGNTFIHRETLKKAGFMWARKKQAWYWRPEEEKGRRHSHMNLDEIKEKYGAQSFTGAAAPRLA